MTSSLRTPRIGWIILLLVATGAVVRALRLTWQPLWWDEGYSVYFATEPLARMLELTAGDIHPPLYYALLHGWINVWGAAAPVALRTFSVIVGVAALPLQAWLAWRLFPGRRRLLVIALVLLVVNPLHLFYSQEVRMYGLGMALSSLSTVFFWRWQAPAERDTRGRRWNAIGYILTTTAGLYTLYYFVFVPAAHLLWAMIVHRHALRRLWSLIAGQMLVALLYLPWLLYALPRLVGYVGAKVASDQDVALDPLRYLVRHWSAFTGGHLAWPGTTLPWALLVSGAAVAVIGVALLARRRRATLSADVQMRGGKRSAGSGAMLLLSVLIGVAFVGGWLVSLRFPFFPEGGERLLIFALPYVTLLLAVGIDDAWEHHRAGLWALILLLAAAIGGVITFYTTPRYIDDDYRPLLRQIVQQGRNEDALLAIFPWQVGYWRAYTPQNDPTLTGPTPLLLSNGAVTWSPAVQTAIDAALAKGTLWFPAPLTVGSTLPDAIETYLSMRAANLENRWYGGTRLTAWAALPATEARTTTSADFAAVQLLQAATSPELAVAANQPVAVTLTWQITTPADYNISLRLLDDAGYIWSSREYAAAWVNETPGAQVLQRVGLIVPVGLPPGVYTVGVSVAHQDAQGLSADALTLVGSDTVAAPIGQLTVMAPDAPLPVARLPIRTALTPPVTQADMTWLGFTGPADNAPILAGTELGVTLFLRAETNTPAARDLYVSLLDAQGDGVAGYTGWPLPEYPVSVLAQGELLRAPVRFDTPGALTSGDYRLVAGFHEPTTDARTPPVTLGLVRIVQRRGEFTRPTPAVSLAAPAQLGTHARLYGYTLTPADGGAITLHLYWEVMQPLLPPHHIFVHADAPDGGTLVQQDGPPVTATGPAPSGSWQPGEFLITEHTLSLPAGATLRVGLYDPVSLQRLPVTIDGAAAGDSVALRLP
ncbi:MAG TPA: hypothetical protein GYA08_11640 [Chloroflexi bacterium]|nr:hypothetical protein [Chloroflexota bacterium]